jgi:hypothetical protein
MRPYRVLAGILVAIAASTPAFAAEATQQAGALQGSFIWSPSAPTGKQAYAVFRKTLNLKELPKSAILRLFADSRYVLWINGKCVNRGPCRFDPIEPEYDMLEVTRFLQPGPNALAIVVHHYHDGKPLGNSDSFCGRIMRHAPGVTASLELSDVSGQVRTVRTDSTWSVSTRNRFGASPASWSSIPDNVDARRDAGDWAVAAFDDSAWEKAAPVGGKQWGALRARSIPLLRETDVQPLRVVQRQTGLAVPQNLADKPDLRTFLPIELTAGSQLVLDAGRFVQAYTVIDVDADEGSQLELQYAQTFFSSGNKPAGQGVPASRYTARKGRQTFHSGDTFGGNYVVVRCASGKIRLLAFRLVSRLYPFDVVGKFASNDPLLNDVWSLGVRTIQTCSEDAYVDCASRERVEWLADAVMVAYPISRLTMAGPGIDGKPYWSDPRLFANLLRHIGQSAQPDGRVKAHHPSNRWDIHGYIEDYSCLWIQGLHAWHDNTGSLELVREMWPAVTAQLKWFLDRRSERGLVLAREFVYFGNPLIYQTCEGATLNAFLAKSLADAAELAQLLGDADRQRQYAAASRSIKDAINAQLWDQNAGAYHGGIQGGKKTPATVHAAAMCLYFDIVPAERRKQVERWFLSNIEKEDCLPYQYAFYFEVLARMDSDEADLRAIELIRKRWAPMARFETKTTFEDFGPGENCHEAGGAPTIYLSRHVLGVQLDGPVANRRLLIEPRLGNLQRAEGVVVTECGPVQVGWDRSANGGRLSFAIEIPAGVTARVSVPRPARNIQLMIDGQSVHGSRESSPRFLTVELGAGKHHGKL